MTVTMAAVASPSKDMMRPSSLMPCRVSVYFSPSVIESSNPEKKQKRTKKTEKKVLVTLWKWAKMENPPKSKKFAPCTLFYLFMASNWGSWFNSPTTSSTESRVQRARWRCRIRCNFLKISRCCCSSLITYIYNVGRWRHKPKWWTISTRSKRTRMHLLSPLIHARAGSLLGRPASTIFDA